jgi:hypothetical protein
MDLTFLRNASHAPDHTSGEAIGAAG